jgi:hypothetical protein
VTVGVGVALVPILGVIDGVGVTVGVVVGVGVTQADGLSPGNVRTTPLNISSRVCAEYIAVVPVVPVYTSNGPTALFSPTNLTITS